MSRRGRPVAPLALLVPSWTLSAAAPAPMIRSAHTAIHLTWSIHTASTPGRSARTRTSG